MKLPNTPLRRSSSRGLSLIETLVAVTVLGSLVSVTAPGVARIGERIKVNGIQTELESTLHAARREAVTRNRSVTVRRLSGCPDVTDPADWRCGWETFVDRNRNRQRDPDEPQLAEQGPIQGHRILLEGPDRDSLTYSPMGRTVAPAQSLLITPDRPVSVAGSGQRLCLQFGGTRLRLIDSGEACS